MNRITQFVGLAVLCFCFTLLNINNANAQGPKVSITGNFKALGIDKIEGVDDVNVTYEGETSFSVNLRFYDKNLWAFRLGAGLDRLEYTIDEGLSTNYDVVRQSITGYLGLEKHFRLKFLYPYVGAFVPITFNGNDDITNNLNGVVEQFENGDVTAGFGLLAGANVELFGFLRLGAEFNTGFAHFRDQITTGDDFSTKIRNLEYNTEIVVGFAF